MNESFFAAADSAPPSGQSGSDEERKAVEPEVQSGPGSDEEKKVEELHVPQVSVPPPIRKHPDPCDPCLFHSYTAGCAKGQHCEFSHSVHADQVQAPKAKQRRGHAINRIKRRVQQHLSAAEPRMACLFLFLDSCTWRTFVFIRFSYVVFF